MFQNLNDGATSPTDYARSFTSMALVRKRKAIGTSKLVIGNKYKVSGSTTTGANRLANLKALGMDQNKSSFSNGDVACKTIDFLSKLVKFEFEL